MTTNLHCSPRALGAVLAGIFIMLICAALFPQPLIAALDIVSFGQLTAHSWQLAEIDSQGRLLRLASNPLALSLLLAIGAASVAVTSVGIAHLWLAHGEKAETPVPVELETIDAAGNRLQSELAQVLALLQAQIASGDRYSAALAEANGHLASVITAEHLQRLIDFLIRENVRVKDEIGGLKGGFLASQEQIVTLRASLREARELGLIDALTLLKNRRWLQENLPHIEAETRERGVPLSVVMADIDHFKKINDTHGHQTGDEILKMFGMLLKCGLEEPDVAVRYGGEEFALIFPGKSLQQAFKHAERIRRDLAQKQWVNHRTGANLANVTASFGVAVRRPEEDGEEVLRRADERLYEAKAAGRNRVVGDH